MKNRFELGGGGGATGASGFAFHFDRGSAFLTLEHQNLAELAEAERLELEIPRTSQPLDIKEGVDGFKNRRLKMRRLRILALSGRVSAAATIAAKGPWLGDVTVSFSDGFVSILSSIGPAKARVLATFRLVLSPLDGEVAFIIDEARCYGPSPVPAIRAPYEVLSATGWFDLDGAVARPRALLRNALVRLLPPRGWRIPGCEDAVLSLAEISDGRAVVEFADRGLPTPPAGEPRRDDLAWLKRREELRTLRGGDIPLSRGELAEAREAYARIATGDPTGPGSTARLASLDVSSPELLVAARALLADARERHPDRTDIAAAAAHGAALAEDAAAEAEALTALEGRSSALELYALHMRLGDLLAPGDPAAAARRFEAALSIRRDDPRALERLADLAARAGNRDAFDALVARRVETSPDASSRGEAHEAAGRLLLERFAEAAAAVKQLERAVIAAPKNRRAQMELGLALHATGDLHRAIAVLDGTERGARREGDIAAAGEALATAGEIWLRSGEPGLAAARFKEAREILGGSAELGLQLARALAAASRFPEAAAEFEAALEGVAPRDRDAAWRDAALELGRILFEQLADAAGCARWILRAHEHTRDPEGLGAAVLMELGAAAAGRGARGDARTFFRAAREAARGVSRTTAALLEAEAALDEGDFAAALEIASTEGSGAAENRPRAASIAARAAAGLGNASEATRILERVALNADGGVAASLLLEAARIASRSGDGTGRARAFLEMAAKHCPTSPEIRSELMEMLERSGDRAGLARLMSRGDAAGRVADLKRAADYFLAEGLRSEAVDALRRAFEAARDSDTARMLSDALWNGGDRDESLRVIAPFAEDAAIRDLLARRLEASGRHRDAAELLLLAADRTSPLAQRCRLLEEAHRIALSGGEADVSLRGAELRAAIATTEEAGRWWFVLAGARWTCGDATGSREAIRRGLCEAEEDAEALADAARLYPACTPIAVAGAERAAARSAWPAAEEHLSRAIDGTAGEERVRLLRKRAAIRRSRIGDAAGAARDLLEVQAAGALGTPEMEELVALLESLGRVAEASDVMSQLVAAPACDVRRLEKAARLALAAGNSDRALALWRRAVERSPEPGALIELVKLLDPVRDREELERRVAELSGKEPLLDIPDHVILLEARIRLDLADGRDDDAIADLTRMMHVVPGAADPWRRLVQILERRGEWEALAARMEERLALDVPSPEIARTACALGRVLRDKLGDEAAAVVAFERALAADPENAGAHEALAAIAFGQRRYDALARHLVFLPAENRPPEAALWRAAALENTGDEASALEAYREIAQRDLGDRAGVDGFFRAARSPEHDAEVIELGARLKREGRIDSIRPGALRRLGQALVRRGDLAAGIDALTRADRLTGGDVEALSSLCDAHEIAGDAGAAAEIRCRLAFRFEGSERAAHLVAAARLCLGVPGEATRARRWLESAEEAAPDSADVLLGLADCAAMAGDHAEVVRCLERHRLVAGAHALDARRTHAFAIALTRTRAWPLADVAEMLEDALVDLDEGERIRAEQLIALIRRGAM